MTSSDKYLENKFNIINNKFIKLINEDKTIYFNHFKTVFNTIIKAAKNQDILLSSMYIDYRMSGSVFDDLKISKPNEYDVNILLKLPFNLNDLEIRYPSEIPGFGQIFIGEWGKKLIHSPNFTEKYRSLEKQILNMFMDQNAFRCWFESCLTKALNSITKNNYITIEGITYKITLKKSGPAQTLVIFTPECEEFSVDMVPVYEFKIPQWPKNIKNYPNSDEEIKNQINISWFAVPKPLKNSNLADINLYWRLSFTEQEKRIMHGYNNLKPTIRFLKKTRDNLQMNCVASYYIKTLFLHEIDKRKNEPEFWSKKISYLYLHMLKIFAEAINSRKINFYWDPHFNMLDIPVIVAENYYKRLNRLILKYETTKNCRDLFKIFLNEDELEEVMNEDYNRE